MLFRSSQGSLPPTKAPTPSPSPFPLPLKPPSPHSVHHQLLAALPSQSPLVPPTASLHSHTATHSPSHLSPQAKAPILTTPSPDKLSLFYFSPLPRSSPLLFMTPEASLQSKAAHYSSSERQAFPALLLGSPSCCLTLQSPAALDVCLLQAGEGNSIYLREGGVLSRTWTQESRSSQRHYNIKTQPILPLPSAAVKGESPH